MSVGMILHKALFGRPNPWGFSAFFLGQSPARISTQCRSALAFCGGINPYTLTAKLGLARIDGFGLPERRRAAQLT